MRRWMATALVAVMVAGLSPTAALAGSGGRMNSAIGLTGGALYTWLNGGFKHAGTRNTALLLTGASVMAWHKYKQAKQNERRRAQFTAYRSAYYSARPVSHTRGYRSSYSRRVVSSRGYSSARGRSSRYGQTAYRQGYRTGYRVGYRAGYRAGVRAAV